MCPLLLMAKTSPQSAEACRQPLWWLRKERGVRTGAAGWTCLQSSCVSLSRQHTPDEPESVSPSRSQPQPPRGAPGRRGRVREGREGTRRRGEFVSECPLKAKTLSKFKSCCVAFLCLTPAEAPLCTSPGNWLHRTSKWGLGKLTNGCPSTQKSSFDKVSLQSICSGNIHRFWWLLKRRLHGTTYSPPLITIKEKEQIKTWPCSRICWGSWSLPNSNPKSFHPVFAQNYQSFYVLRSNLLSKTTEEDKGEDSLGFYLEQPSRDKYPGS